MAALQGPGGFTLSWHCPPPPPHRTSAAGPEASQAAAAWLAGSEPSPSLGGELPLDALPSPAQPPERRRGGEFGREAPAAAPAGPEGEANEAQAQPAPENAAEAPPGAAAALGLPADARPAGHRRRPSSVASAGASASAASGRSGRSAGRLSPERLASYPLADLGGGEQGSGDEGGLSPELTAALEAVVAEAASQDLRSAVHAAQGAPLGVADPAGEQAELTNEAELMAQDDSMEITRHTKHEKR